MKPKKPILWFVLFTLLFFLIDYYLTGSDRSFLHQLFYSMLIGVCALATMFGLDKYLTPSDKLKILGSQRFKVRHISKPSLYRAYF